MSETEATPAESAKSAGGAAGEVPAAGAAGEMPAVRGRLRELAGLFLWLGATAFGGPLAHIAMMEREVVVRRRWMTRVQFVDLIGVTNLLPGPNSTEMAMHVGHVRAGVPGLLVAGGSFILPAAAITIAFAWAYVRYGALPETAAILYGTKPVIVAVVAQALVKLARAAVKRSALAVLAVGAAVAAALGVHEVAVLAAAGALSMLLGGGPSMRGEQRGAGGADGEPGARKREGLAAQAAGASAAVGSGAAVGVAAGAKVGLGPLFLVFAKTGGMLFGSGYVLLAFLRADLVERLHWMTEAQLLDAVTVGQVTPGPVFTTATFVGFVLAGAAGAAVATVGIFTPAFVFVGASGPIVRRVRASRRAGAFLDGVNVASLALMAVVAARLGKAAIVDPITAAAALVSLAVLLRFKPNATWLVLGGALLGLAARALGAGV
ncbi:MAG: chromate efflux transporter [Polyangiaceae bacterium]